MSRSTPADLAITFRSLDRREREAIGDADPALVTALSAELRGHIDAVAAVMGAPADGDAVARAIESRPAAEWDEPTLDELRRHALDAGAVLRRIAATVEAAEEGRS